MLKDKHGTSSSSKEVFTALAILGQSSGLLLPVTALPETALREHTHLKSFKILRLMSLELEQMCS